MKILITGICGFAGSVLAKRLLESRENLQISGLDNLIRSGSEHNRAALRGLGVTVHHADIRSATDCEDIPGADWVIDAAANPSVLAGLDGGGASRKVVEHNLTGTVNILEYCRRHRAGFILLSTSRVYSVRPLADLPVRVSGNAYIPDPDGALPSGLTSDGVSEAFSTEPPVSLYGCTKLASEHLALEYGEAFGFQVWINRCGVLAGAGQFGRADQGIFSWWINSWRAREPMNYCGFSGEGFQVRDCLHPADLATLLEKQMNADPGSRRRVQNLSGGNRNAMSLAQLSAWCEGRFHPHNVGRNAASRPYDIPWMVLDSALAKRQWNWEPETPMAEILEEIAVHAEANPNWLDLTRE